MEVMNGTTPRTTVHAIGDHALHRNLHQAQTRSAFAAYLLWFFLGSVGAHLMYTRRWVMLTAHYLLLILVGFGIGMVVHGKEIQNVFFGLAAVWGAILPFGIFSFLGMCILFAQVNYCNEDSALRLAGIKPKLTRVTERLVIIVSVGVFLMFAVIMSYFPDAVVRDSVSTTPDTVTAPSAQTPSVQPSSPEVSSAPAANVEQGNVQPQATVAEATSQVAAVAEAAPAQDQQAPALAPAQPTQDSATQSLDPATDLNTTPNQMYGTSFDCGKSHSQNEYLICHTPALAIADVKLANSVTAAKNAIAPTDLDAFKDRMRGQWNFREKHCNDVACLNTWYQYQTSTMALIEQTRNAAARVDTPQN
ncbi:NINE protein [Paraburkholderia sp. BCC1886]|uniref:NINE protein n=1 Tax=Paraburkholderia sp. BCC1886 TaxID=2562670 RepID=UPI0011837DED|nr:NINE protein [Paraburkholderia sp. BCC1886]